MPGGTRRYRLHGLEVDSELEMSAQTGDSERFADVRIHESDSPPPTPEGQPVAGLGELYSVWEHSGGFIVRFNGVATFAVEPRRVVVFPEAGAPAELVTLLLCGNVMALCLLARNELVLHASAVQAGDGAVCIVGSSGMGKSTLAALLCSTGMPLVSDDVLRVVQDPHGPRCFPGSSELRLRADVSEVRDLLPDWAFRQSVDNRLILRSRCVPSGWLPLRAVFIPTRVADAAGPFVRRRLRGSASLVELLRHPRVLGWKSSPVLELLTRKLGALARSIPVYDLAWSGKARFDQALAAQLRELVLSA